jgi:hypothetical protein
VTCPDHVFDRGNCHPDISYLSKIIGDRLVWASIDKGILPELLFYTLLLLSMSLILDGGYNVLFVRVIAITL